MNGKPKVILLNGPAGVGTLNAAYQYVTGAQCHGATPKVVDTAAYAEWLARAVRIKDECTEIIVPMAFYDSAIKAAVALAGPENVIVVHFRKPGFSFEIGEGSYLKSPNGGEYTLFHHAPTDAFLGEELETIIFQAINGAEHVEVRHV